MSIVIKLIPFSKTHIPNYFTWFKDEEVRRFLDKKMPTDKANITALLQKDFIDDPNCRYFSIYLPSVKRHIGHVGLKKINLQGKSAEIGIVIGDKKYWAKGAGSSAVSQVLKIGRISGISHFTVCVHPKNIASRALFSKFPVSIAETHEKHRARTAACFTYTPPPRLHRHNRLTRFLSLVSL